MAYAVRALDESTWPAFAALGERNDGVFGGCWCVAFHPKPEDADPAPRRRIGASPASSARACAGAGSPPRWPVRWS